MFCPRQSAQLCGLSGAWCYGGVIFTRIKLDFAAGIWGTVLEVNKADIRDVETVDLQFFVSDIAEWWKNRIW